MKIPKIIHQIWIGENPKPVKLMQTWKDKHADYQFYEWNNETIKTRTWRCQKQMDQLWALKRWSGVADLIRYEVLYDYGGFVAPADSVCLAPIDDLLDWEFFCCYENEKVRADLLSPHLGTYPKNDFINFLIEQLASAADVSFDDAWKLTGNQFLTDWVYVTRCRIHILPSYTFIPDHYTGETYQGDGKVYARHFWGSTKGINDKLDQYLLG